MAVHMAVGLQMESAKKLSGFFGLTSMKVVWIYLDFQIFVP
jgi:hypothetical protein